MACPVAGHKAKNFSTKESQSTKVATCVLELQQLLPRARVVYCSATGEQGGMQPDVHAQRGPAILLLMTCLQLWPTLKVISR